VARLADRGAVLLPYSYAGATLDASGLFHFNAYTSDTTKQDWKRSVADLENEIASIGKTWRSTSVYVVAHSYGGSVASHWWAQYHTTEPQVRKVFTLDGTVNGNSSGALATLAVGQYVSQLFSDDWHNLFDNAAARDAALLAADSDHSLITVGTADDPSQGLPIEAQVLVHNCTSNNHCDLVSPPSLQSNCSASSPAIYGIGGGNDGHDVVKVCPMVVELIVSSLSAGVASAPNPAYPSADQLFNNSVRDRLRPCRQPVHCLRRNLLSG
jgi:pimeloyl-ACP methyl ester carboxylesterase